MEQLQNKKINTDINKNIFDTSQIIYNENLIPIKFDNPKLKINQKFKTKIGIVFSW